MYKKNIQIIIKKKIRKTSEQCPLEFIAKKLTGIDYANITC